MPRRPDPDRVRTVLLLLVPGTAAVYLAFRGGGAAAGFPALVAVACLAALVVRSPGTVDADVVAQVSRGAVLALPGALTIYFSFNAGGFFPETPAFVAIVLALVLVVRITTADDPFAGVSWPLAVAAIGLGLYALWILLSAVWSDAPARALIEFDRALVYLLALVLFGSVPRTSASLRWMIRGVALAIVVVGVAALVSRVAPDVLHTKLGLSRTRLGWPLTYWNAEGLLCAIGTVLCVHLAASLREPLAVRVAAAAATPVLGAVILLTFSRGAIVAGVAGLVVYVVAGRPRGLVSAGLATVPFGAISVKAAYDATQLATNSPRTTAAVAQGHDLALTVAACCAGAALARLLLALLDRRLRRLELPAHLRRPVTRGAWAAAALVVLALVVAVDAPHRLEREYNRFVSTTSLRQTAETRNRLSDPANTGRIDHWNVALDGYREEKLHGHGAGTYGIYWMRHRPPDNALVVVDAHSLYVESLEETGLVGLLLVCVAVGTVLAGFLPARRRGRGSLYGALLGAGTVWAVHAGVDWDWEMPAVTIWLFCLGGASLAVRRSHVAQRPPLSSGVRILLGAIVLAGAIAPALVMVSQHQLDDAAAAFNRGDCATATRRAAASIRTLSIRPEPYEVLGFCDVRRGFDRLAVPAIQRAVEQDPGNWEFLYDLAIVRGSAGLDPRAAARAALRQNPHDPLTRALIRYVATSDRRLWVARLGPIARNERLSGIH